MHNVVCSILDAKCIIYNAVYHANYIAHNALCIHVWTDCYIFSGVQIFFTNFSPDASYIVIRFILKDAVISKGDLHATASMMHYMLDVSGKMVWIFYADLTLFGKIPISHASPMCLTCATNASHIGHKCKRFLKHMSQVLDTHLYTLSEPFPGLACCSTGLVSYL